MKHDFAITSTVVCHLLKVDKPSTIRSKSDNCATQFKSKSAFKEMHSLAKESGISVIVCCGVSGHGLGC